MNQQGKPNDIHTNIASTTEEEPEDNEEVGYSTCTNTKNVRWYKKNGVYDDRDKLENMNSGKGAGMMRVLFVAITIGLLWQTTVVQAADPQLTKQIRQLQRQVAILQKELRSVIAIVKVSRGTTHIHAKQHKQEITGGNERSEIGGDRHTQVGRSRTETIGANQSINVGLNQRITIGKDMTLQVGGNLAENVGRDRHMTAGKRTIIT